MCPHGWLEFEICHKASIISSHIGQILEKTEQMNMEVNSSKNRANEYVSKIVLLFSQRRSFALFDSSLNSILTRADNAAENGHLFIEKNHFYWSIGQVYPIYCRVIRSM